MPAPSSESGRYDAVWRAAAPYMKARRNDIHVPLSFAFAERLLDSHPEADTDIVLLAILLHDIGWYTVDAATIESCFETMMESDARVLHEKEGARLAREILERTGWPGGIATEVCTIIDGHDTRQQPLSLNDRLVRDADKLWRFTVTGLAIISDWFKLDTHRYCAWCDGLVLQMETGTGRDLARAELARTRAALMLDLI